MRMYFKQIKWAVLTLLVGLSACDKKSSEEVDDGKYNYAIWMILGSYPDRAFYALGADDLSTGSVTAEGNGAEITSQADEGIIAHNGRYYYPSTLTDFGKFSVYEFANNRFNVIKEVPYTYMSPGAYTWPDNNTLFMIGRDADYKKVLYSKVDASSLAMTNGELDMPEIPEGYTMIYTQAFESRDDKLFISFAYITEDWSTSSLGTKIAVFNYPDLTFEKLIESSDANGAGQSNMWSSPGSCIDENKDLYFMYLDDWSNPDGSPNIILKIGNGDTDFDPSYRFNVKAAVGNNVVRMWYVDDGKAIVRYEDAEIKAANPSTAYYYKYALLDLRAKTLVKKLDLPATNLGNITTSNDGKAFIAIHSETEQDYVWEVNKTTGAVTPGLKINTPSDGLIRLDNLQ